MQNFNVQTTALYVDHPDIQIFEPSARWSSSYWDMSALWSMGILLFVKPTFIMKCANVFNVASNV